VDGKLIPFGNEASYSAIQHGLLSYAIDSGITIAARDQFKPWHEAVMAELEAIE
jgi:hypothetical protein